MERHKNNRTTKKERPSSPIGAVGTNNRCISLLQTTFTWHRSCTSLPGEMDILTDLSTLAMAEEYM